MLQGGDGADSLWGGDGADLMNGGAGADRFFFNDDETGLGAAGRDRVAGFSRAQGDKLDVLLIDADLGHAGDQAFVFRGTAAFTGIGQVRVVASGADRILQFNNEGDLQRRFRDQPCGLQQRRPGQRLRPSVGWGGGGARFARGSRGRAAG